MQRPRRLSKLKAERRHALRRFGERMGFGLTSESYADLIQLIQEGRGEFVRRQSLRVTVWRLVIDGEPVRIAYDKIRKQIITFMPEKAERIEDPLMTHPNEIPLEQLITIRTDLYSQECTPEVAQKIKAVEAQISRHKAEADAKAKAAKAAADEAERVAKQLEESDKKIKERHK